MKQKAWFVEEVKFQEMKRKMSVELINEERKMKNQTSQGKKNKKSKSKKGKVKETDDVENSESIKDIDEALDPLFVEVGLQRSDHKIYKVKGDGACGGNCVAVHCHGECKLGPDTRRIVNQYLVKFWPFYQPSYTFPIVQRVGSKSEPFENEAEYLDFLSNDPRSKY